jgi:iron(III) transport system ATP-binding protein
MDQTDVEPADLKLDEITKRFGDVTAVDHVSLEIPHGRLVTLLGPSGCGKTTVLRMIAGLEVPTSGRIFLGGEDITKLPPNERRITMVFQSYALFPHMNVYENIAYGLRIMRWPEERIRTVVRESLDMVGLAGLEKRGPSELSGGQQQRVAVARALVLKPKVLLFDEPLSNLDAKLRKRMRGEIRNLQKDLGITSVYVTHDQSEALAISDSIVVMQTAVVSQVGVPSTLYTRPANPFVADFIGEANLLDAEILGLNEDVARVRLGSLELSVPCLNAPARDGQAKLMVRPEDIRIAEATERGLKGTIKFALYQGATNDYTVDTEVGEIRVNDYQTKGILRERGAQVSLRFREDHIFLIS